ncbi:hypothetical protein SISSUDRAFT_633719 [Sistotremastrum suecicum HHB10207 ss-3]|uniref:Uncharacterized protein n=1 Tax=Sistotremastrum suecicum HHB10207 ss-3 TaxID=1314776 RepID=A0A166EDB7_9AGAM|nr:hypothetical protein SISSUDRAFT_633719 [Sistotremastrum suecicum HHB10207 ss-3]
MFQSKPDSTTQGLGAYHAAFRAFGAGPVTITDTASRTDTGVTNKLLGKAPGSNHSIALQARSSPWVSEAVFDTNLLGSGTGRALRIFSRDSAPGVHGGMVGYWNVRKDNGKVEDSISLDDIREVVAVSPYTKLGKYAIWSHTKSKLFVADFTASTPSISPSTTSDLSISLAPFSFEIVTISAIDNGIAALGLIDKYNPLGGIISHHWEENFHQLEMKSFGRVGFFADAMPPPFVEVGGRFVQCELIAEDSGYLLALDLDETYEDLTITLYHRR